MIGAFIAWVQYDNEQCKKASIISLILLIVFHFIYWKAILSISVKSAIKKKDELYQMSKISSTPKKSKWQQKLEEIQNKQKKS
tara:strand:+ start:1913 stop:2161 length:249 start_codon:yes stop_codon:yes gene_type:complete